MYFVKLRHADYEPGKVFNFATYVAASNFAEAAICHGRKIDGNPLVAEVWSDVENYNPRKPDNEEK